MSSDVAQHGSLIIGGALVILALAWFIVKALVAHLAATWLGKKISRWWKGRKK